MLERFLAAGYEVTQGQEERVLLRASRRLCGIRLDTAVGIRQAQPPRGFPVRYRLHPCSATEHSHRRAALKPFLPATRNTAYAYVSTSTIYIENPAARSHQCSAKIHGCGSAEISGNPNSRKLLVLRFTDGCSAAGTTKRIVGDYASNLRCITRAAWVYLRSGEFPFVFEPRRGYIYAALSIPPHVLFSARKPSPVTPLACHPLLGRGHDCVQLQLHGGVGECNSPTITPR